MSADRSVTIRQSRRVLLVGGVLLAGVSALWFWVDRGGDPPPDRLTETDRPTDPRSASDWLKQIDRLRVEGRPIEAIAVAQEASRSVPLAQRPAILRAWTLALLADVPETQATLALNSWLAEDPDDLDAKVALLRRSLLSEALPGDRPRIGRSVPGDPGTLEGLRMILEERPEHLGAREVVVDALLDLGDVNEARSLLDAWPTSGRDDPRMLRLRSRLDLDFDGRPDRASASLGRLLASTPHDWQLRARRSRALAMGGKPDEARREAQRVDRLRERLSPDRLGPRLASALQRLDDPDALTDLADLCDSVGLTELANSWRVEAGLRSTRLPGLSRTGTATGD